MPSGSTYTPIATTTLGSAASSYTFSSIPTTYTDLILIGSITNDADGQFFIQVGNSSVDTGSNYSYTGIYGDGSSAASARASSQVRGYLGYISGSSVKNFIVQVMNYSNTTTNKTILDRKNQADQFIEANVILWRSTSAINTIKIFPASGNFTTGSTFTLYGIASA